MSIQKRMCVCVWGGGGTFKTMVRIGVFWASQGTLISNESRQFLGSQVSLKWSCEMNKKRNMKMFMSNELDILITV